ncbi:hypothetical protein [Microbulbifer epialgicus]|uniref:Alkylhydroperoxidase AhpD family core domain-containing protein n=1 Tax=Microbulbifer epialgicus TaxID=393907 RepID=A0ABV4P7E4_9GAMM
MSNDIQLQHIREFSERYQYDNSYVEQMLIASPTCYEKFNAFVPLSHHREQLSVEAFWVAKLAAMQVADCGHCVQLNVRMALESGVDRAIIQSSLRGGSGLPAQLLDVFTFATCVASSQSIDFDLEQRVKQQLNPTQQVELSVCIATAAMYPTIKRALGYGKSCRLVEIDV